MRVGVGGRTRASLKIMIGWWGGVGSLTILPNPQHRDGGGPVPDQRALDDRGGRPHQARDRQGLVYTQQTEIEKIEGLLLWSSVLA